MLIMWLPTCWIHLPECYTMSANAQQQPLFASGYHGSGIGMEIANVNTEDLVDANVVTDDVRCGRGAKSDSGVVRRLLPRSRIR